LIQSVDKEEDDKYIALVESLVTEYLKSENTVILQCFQSDEDIEVSRGVSIDVDIKQGYKDASNFSRHVLLLQNQKIRTLARKVDPEGRRSLGVLTKPDKIEKGTEERVLRMLRGDLYELRWGYFVVRAPRQAELDRISKIGEATNYEKEVSGRSVCFLRRY